MIPAVSRGHRVRGLALAVPFLVGLLLSGCDPEGGVYPTDLRYPPRTDPVVSDSGVKADPVQAVPEALGRLDSLYVKFEEMGGKVYSPQKLLGANQGKLTAALEKAFGTPAQPRVTLPAAEYPDFADAGADLKLDDKTLAAGSKLYRRHCLHCHGLSGDGRGPTAPWVNPHPRDYRKGVFKFISTTEKGKASRHDLKRTLQQGIDGTSMPSFHLLSNDELEQLISYVIHLSLRGMAEAEVITALAATDGGDLLMSGDKITYGEFVSKTLNKYASDWKDANQESRQIKPFAEPRYAPTEFSANNEQRKLAIERGFDFFRGDGGCIKCHIDYGRRPLYRFDAWGTLVQPRNLTAGNFRGGRRAIDLYYRISSGIDPSTMPALTDPLSHLEIVEREKEKMRIANLQGDAKTKAQEALDIQLKKYSSQNIWDIIAFVQAAPYPNMLPPRVRDELYPELKQK